MGMKKIPTNEEKNAVWKAYRDRKPVRVPLRWQTNVRIILLNPELNPEGYTFEQYFNDPTVIMTIQSRHQEYLATVMSKTCDLSSELPEKWNFNVDAQNTYDGAYFGAPVIFEPGQCPSNRANMTEADVDAFLAADFSKPMGNPWLKNVYKLHKELQKAARDFTYLGRKGNVAPYSIGFDGPLTVGAILLGSDMFALLGSDPGRAVAFMTKLVETVKIRNHAVGDAAGGWKKQEWGWMADDSIQLISTDMYEKHILPLHEAWYSYVSDTAPSTGKRGIHLCGDVQRHFPLLCRKLGIAAIDTGFPIDFGRLRREIGTEVEVSGGPHVGLLRNGTPAECAARAVEILQSGIKEGGRFILQEGNNLPPCCPLENLAAVYQACLEYGKY